MGWAAAASPNLSATENKQAQKEVACPANRGTTQCSVAFSFMPCVTQLDLNMQSLAGGTMHTGHCTRRGLSCSAQRKKYPMMWHCGVLMACSVYHSSCLPPIQLTADLVSSMHQSCQSPAAVCGCQQELPLLMHTQHLQPDVAPAHWEGQALAG